MITVDTAIDKGIKVVAPIISLVPSPFAFPGWGLRLNFVLIFGLSVCLLNFLVNEFGDLFGNYFGNYLRGWLPILGLRQARILWSWVLFLRFIRVLLEVALGVLEILDLALGRVLGDFLDGLDFLYLRSIIMVSGL